MTENVRTLQAIGLLLVALAVGCTDGKSAAYQEALKIGAELSDKYFELRKQSASIPDSDSEAYKKNVAEQEAILDRMKANTEVLNACRPRKPDAELFAKLTREIAESDIEYESLVDSTPPVSDTVAYVEHIGKIAASTRKHAELSERAAIARP